MDGEAASMKLTSDEINILDCNSIIAHGTTDELVLLGIDEGMD